MIANPRSGVREQFSTRAIFLLVGVVCAAWAPLVAITKVRLDLDEARLGTLLLCLGLGSIFVMPFSGALTARFGCRRVIGVASLVLAGTLPFLAIAPTVPTLAIALTIFGAATGLDDAAMNVQALLVEKRCGKAMMSGFHGFFSVGGIIGAGLMTVLLRTGFTPVSALLVVSGIAFALLVAAWAGLLTFGAEDDAPAFAIPHGHVLLLAILCFILFLAEGAVTDWGGVFLTTHRGIAADAAGIGYIAFAACMTLGRLTGDIVVRILGAFRVLLSGSLIAAAGFGMVILVPSVTINLLGFGLVGLGAANLVPILFSAAGRQTVMPIPAAIASVTTLGYGGFLLGPAVLGYVARATDLPFSLAIVAGLLVIVAFCSRSATREA